MKLETRGEEDLVPSEQWSLWQAKKKYRWKIWNLFLIFLVEEVKNYIFTEVE